MASRTRRAPPCRPWDAGKSAAPGAAAVPDHAEPGRWRTWRCATTPTACAPAPRWRQGAAQCVDAPNADKNPDLHINTYAITLGVRGSLWPNSVDPFVTAPNWPTAGGRRSVDDRRPVARHHQRPRPDVPGHDAGRNHAGHPERSDRHPEPDGCAGRHCGEHGEPAARGLQGLLRHLQPGRLGRRPDRQRHRPGHRLGDGGAHLVGRQQAARTRLDHPRHRHLQRRRGHGLHRGQRGRHGEPGRGLRQRCRGHRLPARRPQRRRHRLPPAHQPDGRGHQLRAGGRARRRRGLRGLG